MRFYYIPVKYKVTFTYGSLADGTMDTVPIYRLVDYGTLCYAPDLYASGYVFAGYKGLETDKNNMFTVLSNNMVYEAEWKEAEDTPYLYEQYVKNPALDVYELADRSYFEGRTNSQVDVDAEKYTETGYEYVETEIRNTDETAPKVSPYGDTIIRYYYDRTQYVLTYKDGEDIIGTPASFKWGRTINRPADASKAGYVFNGWYLDAECTEASICDFKDMQMPKADLTIYAGWRPATDTQYRIEYYGQNADDDGYTKFNADDICYGTTGDTVSADTFSGSYKTFENFTLNKAVADTVDSATIAADGSTVLKLFYDRNTVTVTFEANGGSFESGEDTATKTFRIGQTFNMSLPFYADDYGFGGWFTENGEKYNAVEVNETEDFTLKAAWNPGEVNYTVLHYVMGVDGSYLNVNPYSESASGAVDSNLDVTTLIKDELLVENGICYDGAEARLYDEELNIEDLYIKKGMVVRINYYRVKHNVKWVERQDTLPVSETLYYGAQIVAPDFSKEGYRYTFEPDVPATMPANEMTFEVKYEPIEYEVVFNGNNANAGTSMENMAFTYENLYANLTANAFTRTGYEFLGWSTDPNAETATYADKTEVSNIKNVIQGNSVTLYAVWKAKTYKVSLKINLDTGVSNKGSLISFKSGSSYSANTDGIVELIYVYESTLTLPTPDIIGFDFARWTIGTGTEAKTISEINSSSFDFENIPAEGIVINADVTKHEYKIEWVYDFNNSNPKFKTTTVYFDSTPILAPDIPTKESDENYNYIFDGWYTGQNDDATSLDELGYITGDLTLYVRYTQTYREYKIYCYNLDGTMFLERTVNSSQMYLAADIDSYDHNWYVPADGGEFLEWIVCGKDGTVSATSQKWEDIREQKATADLYLFANFKYLISVFGKDVTSVDIKNDVNLAPAGATGTIKYKDLKLTITNFNYTFTPSSENCLKKSDNYTAIGIYNAKPITIELIGNNRIICQVDDTIASGDFYMILKTSGEMLIEANQADCSLYISISAKTSAEGGGNIHGIKCGGSITQKNCQVNLNLDLASPYTVTKYEGLYSSDTITIDSAKLNVTAPIDLKGTAVETENFVISGNLDDIAILAYGNTGLVCWNSIDKSEIDDCDDKCLANNRATYIGPEIVEVPNTGGTKIIHTLLEEEGAVLNVAADCLYVLGCCENFQGNQINELKYEVQRYYLTFVGEMENGNQGIYFRYVGKAGNPYWHKWT